MPGITGILSRAPDIERQLDEMIRTMLHEPFYSSGKYVNRELGLYVGWTCHIGSFSDCMPIFNETREIVLFFAGEHFGDQSIADYLRSQGHDVQSSMDARYLVHLYEEKGENFLADLNGFFHGLLVDLKSQKMLLFNDRYGMQRMYYYEGKNEFLLSAEAKSILKIRPRLRKLKLDSLGEFLSCGCVLENKTLFPEVFLLPGGSAWKLQKDHSVARGHYFIPKKWEDQPTLPRKAFYDNLRETVKSLLPRYLSPENKVGLSLTAGLDTRMILASVEIPCGSLPCYTFGGLYRDSFDVKISRKVAETCGQNHTTIRLDNTFLMEFPSLVEKVVYITDGCLEASGAPNLYVNRLAREIAPIRLTGNYGQEVLRRYLAFKPSPPPSELFDPDFLPHLSNVKKTYDESLGDNRLSFALFKQAPWYQYGRLSLEQSQLVQRSPYMDNDLVRLVYQAPLEAIKSSELSLQLIKDGSPELAKIPTDRGTLGKRRGPVSVFARAYCEFLFKMDYYYSHGMSHWMANLDNSVKWLQLGKVFLGRHKYYHLGVWFREVWADYIRDILLSRNSGVGPYLNKLILEKTINRHIKGDHNFTETISVMLTLEIINRSLIEGV
jgi:asparagine synthase (glutamine-hydrolysing)